MVAYFGHHKCASTYIGKILYEIIPQTGFKTHRAHLSLLTPNEIKQVSQWDFVISPNTSYQNAVKSDFNKAFHVIRDPRDIIVSGYFSHLYSHSTENWPSLAEHRKKIKKLNIEEGLLAEIEFSSYFLNHLESWDYSNPNILEIKMEDLVKNPLEHFIKVLDFMKLYDHTDKSLLTFRIEGFLNKVFKKSKLNLKLSKAGVPKSFIDYAVDKNSFQKLSKGRNIGSENKKSHYRKGQANDWINYFNKDHKKAFLEKFPTILNKTGYSESWQNL